MKKIVGVQSAANDRQLNKDEIMSLRQEALSKVQLIDHVPTLQELYAMVDNIWASGHTSQLIFKNKDQHYEYITQIYNEQWGKMSLEQYRKMVYAQTARQFDTLLSALDAQKQKEAYELHKQYEEKATQTIEELGDELVERNKKANSEQREKITEVTEALRKELKHASKGLY